MRAFTQTTREYNPVRRTFYDVNYIYRAVFKSKPKHLPITTSNYLNSLKARERSRVQGAIGFASHWLKNWRESFKPITKRSTRNHVITFDSHLKTALSLSTCINKNTLRKFLFFRRLSTKLLKRAFFRDLIKI